MTPMKVFADIILADADETIAIRQDQIEIQRRVAAGLEAEGQDAADALHTLERLELAQILYKQHRERLA
jgi:hypothetical protein